MIGQSLSHYEITGRLGAGGMGEVYRARDSRLGREVAIKVVPEDFGADAERLARFEREARVLASLNHPHIAQIYGLEEDQGRRFLVLELVEGETLAERIGRGAIPVDQTLSIALQIAEGLEAAHERGIVHRDLKPANIMLTPDGQAKVLDFGISKPLPTAAATDQARTRTLTRPPTRDGVLIGTPAYMSPEQVRGQAVDRRSDIWSFGVVLWEMLTGKQLFLGETDSDIIAAVLQVSPAWQELPLEMPSALLRLLHRCLEEDPRERLHDIADARIEIQEAIARPEWFAAVGTEQPEATFWDRMRGAWAAVLAAATVGALLAGGVVWRLSGISTTKPGRPIRIALNLPPGVTTCTEYQPGLAISPDGRFLVLVGESEGASQLFRRDLELFDAMPMPGTEGGRHPFFSPDGRWVGFFADGKLKKVPLAGGPSQIIAEASTYSSGASWGPDGSIVFDHGTVRELLRVHSAGGTIEVIATPDLERGEIWFSWPEILPDGQAVLFTSSGGINADDARIEVLDLGSRARKTLVERASYAHYIPTGHLIFGRGNGIHVAPFDVERREVTGPTVPVPEPVLYDFQSGVPHLAVSTAGSLAFVPGTGPPGLQLVSVDLEGRETLLVEARRGFAYPRFSPDGERLAVTISEPGDTNVWVLDLSTGAQTKLTLEGRNDVPVWTPDGERVTFESDRDGVPGIFWKRADGSGNAEPLMSTGNAGEGFGPYSWAPDGNALVAWRSAAGSPEDWPNLWMLSREGDLEPVPLASTGGQEIGAAISPDGRWLAYTSGESGRREAFVQPFPGGGERYQISTGGALPPVWSRDGRAIYYRSQGQVLAVPVSTTPRFRAGVPRVLFRDSYTVGYSESHPNFGIAPDGKSFVMVKPDEEWGRVTEIRVIVNWFEELKRLVPPEVAP